MSRAQARLEFALLFLLFVALTFVVLATIGDTLRSSIISALHPH